MFDFPNAPTTGQIITGPGGTQYKWDGTKWVAAGTISGPYLPLSGGTLTGPTQAPTPTAGDSSTNLATTAFVSGALAAGGITVSDTAPANPATGKLWFDSVGLQTYLWYTDPTSSQWTPVNNVTTGVASFNGRTGPVTLAQADVVGVGVLNDVGRNYIHNPMFNVAQRGVGPFTALNTSGTYTLDRWSIVGTLDTISITQAALADADRTAIGDEAAEFCFQNVFTGNSGATAYDLVWQPTEDVRRLGGKTLTISFWAKASAALKLGINVYQWFGTGGSPSTGAWALTTGIPVNLTTSWARYSAQVTIPSTSGKTLGTNNNSDTAVAFWYSAGANTNALSGNIGVQSGTVQLWGVQVEVGNVATPLAKRDPADDLALCQRFFINSTEIFTLQGLTATGGSYNGWIISQVMFPTTMRATPIVTATYTGGSSNPGVTIGPQPHGFAAWGNAGTSAVNQYASFSWTASADL